MRDDDGDVRGRSVQLALSEARLVGDGRAIEERPLRRNVGRGWAPCLSIVGSKGVDDVEDGHTLDVRVVLESDGVVESVEEVVSGRTRDGVCISRRLFPASNSRGRKDRLMMGGGYC